MIPDYQTLMLPVLKSCTIKEVSSRDVIQALTLQFDLTPDEQQHRLPSGQQTTIYNRVQWAKSYLKQAGLVRYTSRGYCIITELGSKTLGDNPERIDNNFLMQFESFKEFRNRRGTRTGNVADSQATELSSSEEDTSTPDERLRLAYKTIEETLAADLLDRVRQSSPSFFEELIMHLLLAMGYGGTEDNAGRALGRSGDDGVDGVIDQDPLGLDQVYIQAKRFGEENTVGSGAIRDFIGALSVQSAPKGVFLTSSSFTQSAKDTARRTDKRIILIDGLKLVHLMMEYNIGCREGEVLRLKKIDEDFFE